jgi:hypothetical protein
MGLLHRLLSGHVRPADCPNKGLPGHGRRIIRRAMRRYLEGSVRDWEVLADIIPVPRAYASAVVKGTGRGVGDLRTDALPVCEFRLP